MVRARWPGIQLEVQVGFPGDVVTGVEQGRLDIAVCHLDDRVLPATLRARLVQRLVPVCLVREGHPLLAEAARGPIPAARLAGFEMAGSRLSPRMVEWLTAGLGRPPHLGFVSADYEMVAKVMSLSDMFALMSRGFAEELRRHWPLALLDVTLPPYLHEVYVVSRTPLRPRSAVAVVHAILCEALARDETRQLEVDDRQGRKG
jgi:DNA-binding transcriptional LysR family regulator